MKSHDQLVDTYRHEKLSTKGYPGNFKKPKLWEDLTTKSKRLWRHKYFYEK